jgi:predicted nucleic acid-binding protein
VDPDGGTGTIRPAMELKADVVIIDEHEARQTAGQVGLSVTGVLGILLRAKAAGGSRGRSGGGIGWEIDSD